MIKYAGLTPGSAGLYQINLEVPEGTGNDPEIRVTAGNLDARKVVSNCRCDEGIEQLSGPRPR